MATDAKLRFSCGDGLGLSARSISPAACVCLKIRVESSASYRISIDGSAAIAPRPVLLMADVILYDDFKAKIHLLNRCLASIYVSQACTNFFFSQIPNSEPWTRPRDWCFTALDRMSA